jgi:hypothetical protein
VAEPLAGTWRVAVLPLANYTEATEAPDRLGALLGVELAKRGRLSVVEPGRVEAVFATEPWLLTDRIPPDLVDSFGKKLQADALLVGSVLAYGTRGSGEDAVPQITLALRLVEVPGGRVLWSAVHSRDGADRESVFGVGRTNGMERLAGEAVREIVGSIPLTKAGSEKGQRSPAARGASS